MNDIPEVEKKLKKQRNGLIKLTAFLGIGLTVASIQKLGFSGVSLVSPLFILGVETYQFHKMIGNNKEWKRNAGLFTKFFMKRGFNKWMKNYFNDSEDMTEQKYKAIFLGLWLRQRNLKYETLVEYDNKVVHELSNKLVTNKETSYSVLDITNEHDYNTLYSIPIRKSQPSNTQSKLATLKDFLEEDFGNTKAINTAKKVYQEYKNNGFIINFLDRNLEDFLSCMYLQDYKLEEKDYETIKTLMEKIKKEHNSWGLSHGFKMGVFSFVDKEEINTFNKIIENENNISNLNLLKDFIILKSTDDLSFGISKNTVVPSETNIITTCIEKRINYISIKQELEPSEYYDLEEVLKPRKSKANKI